MIEHPFPPLYDGNSKILILGSFPSVKSREKMFFYGHKQNRFWRVISAVLTAELPTTIDEKRKILLDGGVALWDVIASCDIVGSADSSIKNVRANDLSPIFAAAQIRQIFVNGRTAEKYYNKFTYPKTQRHAVCLPSTSPANAAWKIDALIETWRAELAPYL